MTRLDKARAKYRKAYEALKYQAEMAADKAEYDAVLAKLALANAALKAAEEVGA